MTTAAAPPMTQCACPVIIGIPPVLTSELLGLPVALVDPELVMPLLVPLELTAVCLADVPALVVTEVTAREALDSIEPGDPPAVIVTGTAPAFVPKFEYVTVANPPAAPVARIEPLQTP